ncbi:protein RFT1 homolog [Haliotis rubra]|uniref:protein RFT1 homolog n=1 Tax=Haliotis rubra TaxID=36100 RepID=UPI001EE5A676|nr:protein RFT1 homolog [Haliotis rubra]XP_046548578.1 protein RFT1 homolog [Haliotis rubra]XP_046548579.1 protein RFT1 homolog [Haliotis rubra]
MKSSSDLLAGAAKATTYNMALQLMLRVMTFFLNAFVLRFITKDLLGVVNVRLLLLHSTVLFLSCEPFDKACLSKQEKKDWRQVVNLMWCAVPISLVFATVFSLVWMFALELPDPDAVPYYNVGVVCFCITSVLECVADPLWLVARAHLFVKLKVLAFGANQTTKCVLTVLLIYFFPSLGLLAFCIAQVTGAAVYCVVYYAYFTVYVTKKKDEDFPLKSVRDFFPQRINGKPYFDRQLTGLVGSFFQQSLLKQLLTEGEKYVMTFVGALTFADQGVYDVINNLGSMAARFIFQPIEESGNLFFSQLLVRGIPVHQQKQDSAFLCSQVLAYVLKTVTLIGLTILVFGQSYSFLALDLYGGSILSSGAGPSLLRWYCLYVLFIAINGITEGFVFATMSKEDVDRYNKKMFIFSGVFLLSSWLLTKLLGSVGFILANCFNMLVRILHSVYFTRGYYRQSSTQPLWEGRPSLLVLVSLGGSHLIMYTSEKLLCCDKGLSRRILHIAIGAGCLLVVLLTVYISEKKLIAFVRDQFNKRKHTSNEKKKS